MNRIVSVTSALVALLVISDATNADMTYNIENYPADQNGATLSGTITTDGEIGPLATSDIVSWSWTVTTSGGTSYSFNSSMTGSQTAVTGDVVESRTSITIAYSPDGESLVSLSDTAAGYNQLVYYRDGIDYAYRCFAGPDTEYPIWGTMNPVVGNTDPWVIAVAPTSVPEPTSLTLAGFGAFCAITCIVPPRRKATCVQRTA